MLAMMPTGQLLKRVQSRVLIAAGFGISAFSLWQMSGYTFDMSEGVVMWTGFLQGLGLGLISVPLTTATFSILDPALHGDSTSIYSLSRNISSSIGISFVQAELTRNTQISRIRRWSSTSASSIPYCRTAARGTWAAPFVLSRLSCESCESRAQKIAAPGIQSRIAHEAQ